MTIMKKLLLPLLVATSLTTLTACGDCQAPTNADGNSSCPLDKKHAKDNMAANKPNCNGNHQHAHQHGDSLDKAKAGALAGIGALAMGGFDWNGINTSAANIGDIMDFGLPEGMKIKLPEGADAGQTISKVWETTKLNLFDGKQIVTETGKLDYLDVVMKQDGTTFDKAAFDKNVGDYMSKIGAVELFNDVVPTEVSEQVNSLDGMDIQSYMAGDFAERTVRQFAVNHADGKRIYQVMSDDNHGEIGILSVNTPAKGDANQADATTDKVTDDVAQQDATNSTQPSESEAPKATFDDTQKLVLNINFDTAKATVRKDSMDDVEQLFALLTDNPELKLSIEGHTDNTGDSQMNKTLSQQRAETVMATLIDKGIDANRLKAVGFGDTKPMVANDTAENKAKNRRVEAVQF